MHAYTDAMLSHSCVECYCFIKYITTSTCKNKNKHFITLHRKANSNLLRSRCQNNFDQTHPQKTTADNEENEQTEQTFS